ncbi:MAG: LCP family protein [Lachnospiraceae bacterium]|nr:LCP family protein [Lachnospiraceae bacterium]
MKILEKILSAKTFLCLQLIATIVCLFFMVRVKFLPAKYIILVAVVLVFMLLLTFLLQLRAKETSIRAIFSRMLAILMCVMLVMATVFVRSGYNYISGFADADREINVMSVIVLNESGYKKIDDLKNKKIGLNNQVDKENIVKAKNDVNKKVKASYKVFDNFVDLANNLYNKKTDAILINEAFRGLIEEEYEMFSDETSVIYQMEISRKTENLANTGGIDDGVFNVCITGIDTTGPVSTVSRSDVNMIMTVNMNTHKIILTSIPRDYYVTLASHNAKDKLTHSGIYGVNETVKTLENLLDIKIDYYVRINFTSLIKIVDVLGGVDVESDRELHLGNITIQKGMNHMDGEMALAYSRERHSYEEGDRHRIQNQQDVILAIIQKLKNPNILFNYQELLQKIDGTFETNISSAEIAELIQMQLSKMENFAMERQYLDGKGVMTTGLYSMPNSKLYTMIPDQDTVDAASKAIKELEEQ